MAATQLSVFGFSYLFTAFLFLYQGQGLLSKRRQRRLRWCVCVCVCVCVLYHIFNVSVISQVGVSQMAGVECATHPQWFTGPLPPPPPLLLLFTTTLSPPQIVGCVLFDHWTTQIHQCPLILILNSHCIDPIYHGE